MKQSKAESIMHRLRYISLISVIASGVGSILMFIIGAGKTVRAYLIYFPGGVSTTHDVSANLAVTYLIQSIDAFLIGLVMMIFSAGVYSLFIRRKDSSSAEIDSWVNIKSITQLKRILAELVIVILFVKFLEGGLKVGLDGYTWEMLVLPMGILMLALSLKFMGLHSSD